MSLRRSWALVVLTALVGPPPLRAADPPQEDRTLQKFFQAYLEEVFRRQPMKATRLGDHRFDDQLDDLSPDGRRARLEHEKSTLVELPRRVRFERLSRDGQIDFEILRHHLERSIWLEETFHDFEDDPRVYGEYLTESIYVLLTQSSLPRAVNLKHALARMEQIPRVVDVARTTLKAPPRVKVETAIRQTEGAIHFYRQDLFRLAAVAPGRNDLTERAQAVATALEHYREFLRNDVLPRSTDAWRIGPARFRKKLELECDAALTAEEVIEEAERETARVESEMAVIARQAWGTAFPSDPLPPDDPDGRREAIRRVLGNSAQDHGTAATLVDEVRTTVREIREFITERRILRLPEPDHCRIVEMPEFLRGNSVAYLEPTPPLDLRGWSEYAISPPPRDWPPERAESYLQEYNRAMLKILTIHEAYPGHYVQLEYSNRTPSPIRRVLSSGTFAEGWAVYTEPMMLDQGYGRGDVALRLQQLKFYLRAVVNAILDHRMHAGSMTDAEAMDLLTRRAFQTEGEALGKILRAKLSSAQLSTYFVGRTAFDRLRRTLQRELGDRFRLDRFHEAVLAHGTIPVKYLPELVRQSLDVRPAPSRGPKPSAPAGALGRG